MAASLDARGTRCSNVAFTLWYEASAIVWDTSGKDSFWTDNSTSTEMGEMQVMRQSREMSFS